MAFHNPWSGRSRSGATQYRSGSSLDLVILGQVSDRDAPHRLSTRNATRVKILMKNRGRNTTFSSFLLEYRGRTYTNFPETWKKGRNAGAYVVTFIEWVTPPGGGGVLARASSRERPIDENKPWCRTRWWICPLCFDWRLSVAQLWKPYSLTLPMCNPWFESAYLGIKD